MNPLLLKSVGGIFALSAAAAAGVGISHAYSGSSADIDPNPVSGGSDITPSVEIAVNKVGSGTLSSGKRWLDLDKDGVEWGLKVNKYKDEGKNDLEAYGFKWEEVQRGKENSNVTNMQEACRILLGKDFKEDLFNVALEWCSVEKKIRWSQEQNGTKRALILEGVTDETNWKKRAEELKEEKDTSKKFGISSDEEKKLKEKCKEVGDLVLAGNEEKIKLFRKWCMIKRS